MLVIESDALLRQALVQALTAEGHQVDSAASGEAGLALARAATPDVVVFDVVLPEREDVDLVSALRSDPGAGRAALLVLTESNEEQSRVSAFEAGVDDYLLKPPSMRELMLRVRALLRRKSRRPPPDVISVGALHIDRAARRVDVGGQPIDLTRREFDVLVYLADHAGRVLSRDTLVGTVWGEIADSGRVVDTTIKRLRKKLGVAGTAISTVRGVGYKIE